MGLFGRGKPAKNNNHAPEKPAKPAGSRKPTGSAKPAGSRKPAKTEKMVLNHPQIGEVTVARNPRAKRITISVRPPSGIVRLTLPVRVSAQEGMRFLESKREWIAAAQERARTKALSQPIVPPYSTRSHTLEFRQDEIMNIRINIVPGLIKVTYPKALCHTDERVQAAVRKGIEEAWRIEAQELLPRRTAEIARELGFRYKSVRVRNTVSKWGSCSVRDDISLSLHLMRLPDELVDYIIIHELCHTVHKNHGPQFHALLDRHTDGRHAILRKQLRAYTTRW